MATTLYTKNGNSYPGPDLAESSLNGKVNENGYPKISIQLSSTALESGTLIGPLSGMTVLGEPTEIHFFTVFNKVISFSFDNDQWFDLTNNPYDYRSELAAILNSNSIDQYADVNFSFADLITKVNQELSGTPAMIDAPESPVETLSESSLMALLLALTNTSTISQPSPTSATATKATVNDEFGEVPILTNPLGVYVKSICAYMSDWHRNALKWFRDIEDTSNYTKNGNSYNLRDNNELRSFLVDKLAAEVSTESLSVNTFNFDTTPKDYIQEYEDVKESVVSMHLSSSGDLFDLYYNPNIPDSPLSILDNTTETPETLVDILVATDELQASSKILYQQILGTTQVVTTTTREMTKNVIDKIQKLRSVRNPSIVSPPSERVITKNIRTEYAKYFSAYKKLLSKARKVA